jgi:hypothetical protein
MPMENIACQKIIYLRHLEVKHCNNKYSCKKVTVEDASDEADTRLN